MSSVHKGGTNTDSSVAKYGALAYFQKPFDRRALLEAVRKAAPVAPSSSPEKPAWDVESGPQGAAAAEAMQVTARIDLQSGSMQGTSPLQLKPMDRDQAQRLRELKPTTPPPVMQPKVRSAKVTTGPIPPAPTSDPPALQPLPDKEGVRRGDLRDNLPQLLAAFYAAKETGELGLMKGQGKKIIYFEGGFPVFAPPHLVADRLGHFLVRAGKTDEPTLKQAAEEATANRQRTGDMLILMGAL